MKKVTFHNPPIAIDQMDFCNKKLTCSEYEMAGGHRVLIMMENNHDGHRINNMSFDLNEIIKLRDFLNAVIENPIKEN